MTVVRIRGVLARSVYSIVTLLAQRADSSDEYDTYYLRMNQGSDVHDDDHVKLSPV